MSLTLSNSPSLTSPDVNGLDELPRAVLASSVVARVSSEQDEWLVPALLARSAK